MEPGMYYLHDTYVEILRPIKVEPVIQYDSVGNIIKLEDTKDGKTHQYLISTSYTDSCAATNIKNHPDCYHLELKSGQISHILYYDMYMSISVEPLPIPVQLDKKIPSSIAYVDWVALGEIDNNGVLAEKLFFDKDEAIRYFVKFIKAMDEIELEKEINKYYDAGDIIRIVGIDREPTDRYTAE